jgi:hypothetical protein
VVLVLPIFISAARHGHPSPEQEIRNKSYEGINMIRVFYLHKRPNNDVAPGNNDVGLLRHLRHRIPPIPTSTPTKPTPGKGGQMPRCQWEKELPQKNHRPPLHCTRSCRHLKRTPKFRYHPQKLMSWLELLHRFQRHYAALHDHPPYPCVMPLTPTVVNPYLTLPDHIAHPPNDDIDDPFQTTNPAKNDTNALPNAHDARQPTSKRPDNEEIEPRPPAPNTPPIVTITPR